MKRVLALAVSLLLALCAAGCAEAFTFRDGVAWGMTPQAVLAAEGNLTRLEVILREGKNREIRRMAEALGKTVIFLKRVAIGDLKLGGLSRGATRFLTTREVLYLKKIAKVESK